MGVNKQVWWILLVRTEISIFVDRGWSWWKVSEDQMGDTFFLKIKAVSGYDSGQARRMCGHATFSLPWCWPWLCCTAVGVMWPWLKQWLSWAKINCLSFKLIFCYCLRWWGVVDTGVYLYCSLLELSKAVSNLKNIKKIYRKAYSAGVSCPEQYSHILFHLRSVSGELQ